MLSNNLSAMAVSFATATSRYCVLLSGNPVTRKRKETVIARYIAKWNAKLWFNYM